MVGIQDTETHLRRRKNWNRGMGPAAVREYEHFITKRAGQLVDRLGELKGRVIIGNWFNYFSCVFHLLVSITNLNFKWVLTPEMLATTS